LAHAIISKFAYCLPLYRQSQIYAREGVDLDRSAVAEWVGRYAALLAPLADAISRIIQPMPRHLRRTATFDNGTEFSHHYTMHGRIGVETYFCDPHSPWQKGGVENAIGRIRWS